MPLPASVPGQEQVAALLGRCLLPGFWGPAPVIGVLVSGIGYRGSFSSASIACGVRSRPESGRRDRSARATARRVCRMLRLRRCGRSVPSTSVQPVGCSLSSRRHAAVSLSSGYGVDRKVGTARCEALQRGACVAIPDSQAAQKRDDRRAFPGAFRQERRAACEVGSASSTRGCPVPCVRRRRCAAPHPAAGACAQ